MLKYLYSSVTFQEVPDEISLCISISNCPIHCKGCHSPELWEDKGKSLDAESITDLVLNNPGITCVCFMGGDREPALLLALLKYVKNRFNLKTGWYSGKIELLNKEELNYLDYIKTGPYIEELGGLESHTTNQRFYRVNNGVLIDETNKFWK